MNIEKLLLEALRDTDKPNLIKDVVDRQPATAGFMFSEWHDLAARIKVAIETIQPGKASVFGSMPIPKVRSYLNTFLGCQIENGNTIEVLTKFAEEAERQADLKNRN